MTLRTRRWATGWALAASVCVLAGWTVPALLFLGCVAVEILTARYVDGGRP